MIPHRMLSNEFSGSGLKERVTACRKRLRVSRVAYRPHSLIEADELFPEIVPGVSEFPGRESEMDKLLLTEEQEVGIT